LFQESARLAPVQPLSQGETEIQPVATGAAEPEISPGGIVAGKRIDFQEKKIRAP
jgi:hypothetical protein